MIVDSPGLANPWRALFGSIFYPSGEGVFTIHERKRHQELMAHLEELFAMYPDAFFFVVLDNASAHTTPKLDEFKEKHKGQMGWVYQPTYSPHLNLIERLWRLMRSQVTKHFYEGIQALCEAAVEWLTKLPFSQFCSLMGIIEIDGSFVIKTK